jgi:pimeloyl-ACP methyl ester carboxylesterase
VALAYVDAKRGALDEAWILDSNPGARPQGRGSESTLDVLRTLEGLPKAIASRDAFIADLEAAGISRATSEWLAMNVVRDPEGGSRLRLNLVAIRALLEDYLRLDLWRVVEEPPGDVKIHFVIGGRSEVFAAPERARAEAAAGARPDRVDVATLADAGHWVHVDAPEELLARLVERTPA